MGMQETIELFLKTSGMESLDELIAQLKATKVAGEDLTDQQQKTLSTLEALANFTKDVGTAEAQAADAALELARDQKIANEILVESQEEMRKTAEKAAELAGAGKGESGEGGYAGVAANALKAEKVMAGLASGSGFGRMGPMLESITSALGVAGGAGMAAGGLIFGFEALLPKIEAFVEKMTGAAEASKKAAEALEAHSAAMKKNKEISDKLTGAPSEEQQGTNKAVSDLLGNGAMARDARKGIFSSLQASGEGKLSNQERQAIYVRHMDSHGNANMADVNMEIQQLESTRLDQSTNAMMAGLGTSPGVQSRVQSMASANPQFFGGDTFGNRLAQTSPEARAEAKREEAENVEADIDLEMEEGERIGKKEVRIAAAKAKNTKQREFDKTIEEQDEWNEWYKRDQATEQRQAKSKAEHAKHKAEAQARKDEAEAKRKKRENTPEKQMERIVSENTHGYNPDQQRHIAHEALNSVSTGAMIGDAVQAAVAAENQRIREDFFRRMKRMQHDSESFYPG